MAARKRKQTKSSSQENVEETTSVDLSKIEQIKIDQLISQAIARHKNEIVAEKKEKIKELNHFASVAEEYLNCFILIGFSMQDERVVLQSTHSSKDELALMDLLRSTYFELASNRP